MQRLAPIQIRTQYANIRTHTHKYSHTHKYAHSHTLTHTHTTQQTAHAHTNTHTNTHAHTHTHTQHTHTHTHTQIPRTPTHLKLSYSYETLSVSASKIGIMHLFCAIILVVSSALQSCMQGFLPICSASLIFRIHVSNGAPYSLTTNYDHAVFKV